MSQGIQRVRGVPAVAAIFALAISALAPPAAGGDDGRIALTSVYLDPALGSAHRVEIVGTLGGKARVTLDPNTCTVNPFGDPEVCTEMAALPVEVTLKQAKVADPSRKGRRLYLLAGDLGPEGSQWFLVAPRRSAGVYRLVVDLGQGRRRILTLEPLATYTPQGGGEVPLAEGKREPCEATYTAERVGDEIRVTARGEHPTAGYKIVFERLPIRIYPPQFRLVHVRPTGMVPQVVTPFEVRTSFAATGIVTHVRVHDAKGSHRVAVANRAQK